MISLPPPSGPDPPPAATPDEDPGLKVPWSGGDIVRALVLTICAVGLVLLVSTLVLNGDRAEDEVLLPGALWLLAIQTGVLAGSAWLFSARKYGGGLAVLGFGSPLGRFPYLLAAGVWVAALVVSVLWSLLVIWIGPEWLKPPDTAGALTSQFGANTIGLILVVIVWGPIGEELFFRGFVLPGLVARFGVTGAVVLSSGLFALFHLDPGSLVPTFVLGVALAWIRMRTRSVWPAVMAHSLQNALVLWLAGGTAAGAFGG